MNLPRRQGLSEGEWERLAEPFERSRARDLKGKEELSESGGIVVIWHRTNKGIARQKLGVQPGIADDPPSLLSTLAAEIAWPGVQIGQVRKSGEKAVAVWARVWQVHEAGDLRLFLRWDDASHFHGDIELLSMTGKSHPLMNEKALIALLNQVAVKPQSSESPHGLLLAGNRAMEAGDYQAAKACYLQAIEHLPRHPQAHRNLALALARQQEWDKAAEVMGEAWALAPRDMEVEQEYLALETDAGIQAATEGDTEKAAGHFLRILEHWPEESTALVNLGNIRLREGRQREAAVIFRRFLRLHPKHAVADKVRLALEEIE